MKNLLIIVDYQYDFVAQDGLLTVGKPAQDIEENIYLLSKKYINNEDDIILTLDSHIKEEWKIHPESKNFKIHCEENTKGQAPYGKIKSILDYKNTSILKKTGYCPLNKDIENIINMYNKIQICGVVTDICVLQTAITLYNASVNNKRQTTFKLSPNTCASFDKDGHIFAINYMKNILGFQIVTD